MKEKITTIDQVAKYLAKIHVENEPGMISEVWLFPDKYDKEVRLVELDKTAMPHDNPIAAFGFPPFSESKIPFRVALAVIRPEEKEMLDPPPGWGNWNQAKKIWPS